METETKAPNQNTRLILIFMGIIIVLLVAVLAVFLLKGNDTPVNADAAQSVNPSQGLVYANEGVTIVDDADNIQAVWDEMKRQAAEANISLDYKNLAISEDGKNFTCYLGNSADNIYDMYINIYGDMEFTDELFLSGLIRPGEAFESIELTRTLEPGVHEVYCAFTQVEDDHSTVHGQIIVAIEFSVGGTN